MSNLYPYSRGKGGRRIKRKSPLKGKKKKHDDLSRYLYKKLKKKGQLRNYSTTWTGTTAYTDNTKMDFAINDEISQDRKQYDNDGNRHYVCEECGRYLPSPLKKENFSHHITKGSSCYLRHVKSNIDILCFDCHQKWEFGDRFSMKIFDLDRNEWLHNLERLIKEGVFPKFNPPIQYPQELPH